jgi:hypothetical protein
MTKTQSQCLHCWLSAAINAFAETYGTPTETEALLALAMVAGQISVRAARAAEHPLHVMGPAKH